MLMDFAQIWLIWKLFLTMVMTTVRILEPVTIWEPHDRSVPWPLQTLFHIMGHIIKIGLSFCTVSRHGVPFHSIPRGRCDQVTQVWPGDNIVTRRPFRWAWLRPPWPGPRWPSTSGCADCPPPSRSLRHGPGMRLCREFRESHESQEIFKRTGKRSKYFVWMKDGWGW